MYIWFRLPNQKRGEGRLTPQLLINRFWNKVLFTTDCWEWQGWKKPDGYGIIRFNHKNLRVHRVSYELQKNQIPDGMVLDHLCRNKKCVNPEHLEVVTHKENTMRGNGVSVVNMKKTHCPQGHEYTKENTYIRPNSKKHDRQCLSCRNKTNLGWRKYYNKRKSLKEEEKD